MEDHGGKGKLSKPMMDFKKCLHTANLEDLNFSGVLHSWSNRSPGITNIARKLNRVLINDSWNHIFPLSYCSFLTPSISDHTPMIINLGNPKPQRKVPFRYFNSWSDHDDFLPLVQSHWNTLITGHIIFQVVSKLKNLKQPLKSKFGKPLSSLQDEIQRVKASLSSCQMALDSAPNNLALRTQEKHLLHSLTSLMLNEEKNCKQKSRIQWLKCGDSNTSYFYKSIASRSNRNKIVSITSSDGIPLDTEAAIKNEIVSFFHQCLGMNPHPPQELEQLQTFIQPVVPNSFTELLCLIPTYTEIKLCLFSLNSGKAPGPDGYNAHFFKKAWPVIGEDVTRAVRDFFTTGKLLREVNSTYISLVPKVPNPFIISQFRPISCCSTIYKCISKLLANKLKPTLPSTIDQAQSAFIQGRQIDDNILLAQELLNGYHRHNNSPRCSLKIGLKKAFDSVSWDFLLKSMKLMGYPDIFVNWIQTCITTLLFTISINGEFNGFFNSVKGLRQGDPLSPFLFVLVMQLEANILSLFGFEKGLLPVRYLGVPLITTMLRSSDCRAIIDKINLRITHWSSKNLSFAGRLQLIKALLFSTQVYWCSKFNLPMAIIHEMDCLFRSFLWSRPSLKKSGCKVAWEHCCLPKKAEGLGIPNLALWNEANNTPLPCPEKCDKVKWIPSPNGKFSIGHTLNHFDKHLPSIPWTHLVWSKNFVPKLSFTLWVAVQMRLPTLNRRCTSHINATTCTLCNSFELETHDHLFFKCDFTRPLWSFIQAKCGFYINSSSWRNLVLWASHHWKSNSGVHYSSITKLALASLMYNIWMERNRKIVKKSSLSQNALLQQVIDLIRLKLMSSKFADSPTSRRIIEDWELSAFVIRPPAKPPDTR
ncbi:uncharacterized protein LOC132270018 [Cornus florida]|uniref:uncharacterized protein LOC132270018 n=1 Tax=Cornus florida TaxID=4283 RepID=UPI0028968DC8|nr:uncharacterized protein LOC132270018 [Cornus florida]